VAHILIPLPARDFDPTEVAVSWRVLTALGHRVSFATPDGEPGVCDPIMMSGRGLDPWSPIPILGHIRVVGLFLRANPDGRRAYRAMIADPAFQAPLRWHDLKVEDWDGLLLGGGHRARGMRAFLESETLQTFVAAMFAAHKPVAAICHGVVLAARAKGADGRSALYGRKTTALTWALEKTASAIAHVGRFWDPNYYRTYVEKQGQAEGHMSVQHEVMRALASPADFLDAPACDPLRRLKTSGTNRDTMEDERPAFVVRDGFYVSARWPGDTHTFAKTFAAVLSEQA
jgi:putative intracellular protease/amidase